MTETAIAIGTLIVSTSLLFYLAVISFQGMWLFVDKLLGRKPPEMFALPVLYENLGVACAIFGYLTQASVITCMGALLIALRLMTADDTLPGLPKVVEVPLLTSALASLVLMGYVSLA
jgi:hypothetical protein